MKPFTKALVVSLLFTSLSHSAVAGCDKNNTNIDASLKVRLHHVLVANQNALANEISTELNNSIWLETATLLQQQPYANNELIAKSE